METENEKIASALRLLAEQFVSSNELDRNALPDYVPVSAQLNDRNVVDGLFAIATAGHHIADSLEAIVNEMELKRRHIER